MSSEKIHDDFELAVAADLIVAARYFTDAAIMRDPVNRDLYEKRYEVYAKNLVTPRMQKEDS